MKKIIVSVLGITTILAFTLSSCKKSSDVAPVYEYEITQAADQSAFSDASNEILSSISDGLNQTSASRLASLQDIIDVANADVHLSTNKDTLTIDFHGDNATGTLTRTGKIYVYLQDHSKRWYDQNAKWFIALGNSFSNVATGTGLVITRKSDNKTIKLTGSKTITNLTGGNITSSDSVSHQIEGQLNLLFDGEVTYRSWTVSRIRNVVKDNSYYKITVTGFGTNNGYSKVAEYGINRFGGVFTTTIEKPLIIRFCTSRYKLTDGQVAHHRMGKDFTVTYGIDINGAAVTSPCDASAIKINYYNANNMLVEVIKSYL
jgi:hypothetical protein